MLRAWRAAIADKGSGLDHRSRLVGLTISLHMSSQGAGAELSQATIADESGLNKRQVREAIDVLRGRWLDVTPGKPGRGQAGKYRALIPPGFVPIAAWKSRVFAPIYEAATPIVQLSLLDAGKGTNGSRKGTTMAPEVFSSELDPPLPPPHAGGNVRALKGKTKSRHDGTAPRQVAARREIERLTERMDGCGADHCKPPTRWCTRCDADHRTIQQLKIKLGMRA